MKFFIELRNKIEHRHIEKETLDSLIFGECQALLNNYENTLVDLFGEEYALNENLAFSLQFSRVITKEQKQAQRNLLSNEVQSLVDYIHKYRSELSEEVFNSQEFSVKIIAIPKIASASRNDAAVEFIKWESLTLEEKEEVQKLTTIIKDKIVKVEGVNIGRHRPSRVVELLKESGIDDFNMRHHTFLWKHFKVRPEKHAIEPFNTNTMYCYYNEAYGDYLYTDEWVEFIKNAISSGKLDLNNLNYIKAYDFKDYQ